MKLLVLGAIISAVWYGFKMVTRITEERKNSVSKRPKSSHEPGRAANPSTEDMIACPTCSTFISAKSPSSCERSDCPY